MICILQVTNDQTRMIRVAACECLKELELNFPVSKRSTYIITTYISVFVCACARACMYVRVCVWVCVHHDIGVCLLSTKYCIYGIIGELNTVHRKIWLEKIWWIMSYSPKFSSPLFTDTLKMYWHNWLCTESCFLAISFYLYGSPKFFPGKIFPCMVFCDYRH